MTEERGEKWSFEALASYLIIGFLSRLIGFFIRTAIIAVGLLFLLLTVIGGFTTYVFWILAPFIIIGLLGFGLALIVIPLLN